MYSFSICKILSLFFIIFENGCQIDLYFLWGSLNIRRAENSEKIFRQMDHGKDSAVSLCVEFLEVPKTVVSLDAEYQIWHENGTLWEGHIYVHLT